MAKLPGEVTARELIEQLREAERSGYSLDVPVRINYRDETYSMSGEGVYVDPYGDVIHLRVYS